MFCILLPPYCVHLPLCVFSFFLSTKKIITASARRSVSIWQSLGNALQGLFSPRDLRPSSQEMEVLLQQPQVVYDNISNCTKP